jgi:hypothetical protein
MTTLPLPRYRDNPLTRFLTFFNRPDPVRTLPDGRTLDRASMRRVADLPPHLQKDIGLIDF